MPISVPLVDLNDMKEFIGIAKAATEFDDQLRRLSEVATSEIEHATGRNFAYQSITEYFTSRSNSRRFLDLHGTSDSGVATSVFPREYSLSGINIDDTVAFVVTYDPLGLHDQPASQALVENRDFIIDYENSKIIITCKTRYAQRGLAVTYSAGYQSSGEPASLSCDIPDDLREACLYQVQHLRVRSRPDNVGINTDRTHGRESVGSGPFAVRGGLCPEAQHLILPYRRVRTGKL